MLEVFGDEGEESFDLVQSAGICWGEVDLEPGMGLQSGLEGGAFVGAVVVADQVHGQVGADLGVDFGEKFLELDGAVSAVP
ncbi:MAG: hypothetical protein ABJD68_06955, partial [Nakamurella sp.]